MEELGIGLDEVNFVISSHGHPDHTGNNNLFLKAKHIVGYCIHTRDQFEIFPFEQGKEYVIDDWVKVIPTPGHTNEDVSLEVTQAPESGKIIVAGDLFESEDDLEAPHLWMGNSFDPYVQANNRLKILQIANKIIPGHGAGFLVKPQHIQAAKDLCDSFEKERLQPTSNKN
jgi:glyoxylase-like metal-dependent hydrolase (beta-lactamase superfamily II)